MEGTIEVIYLGDLMPLYFNSVLELAMELMEF